jgi:hypothetical protein
VECDRHVTLAVFEHVLTAVRGQSESQHPQLCRFGLDGQLVLAATLQPRPGRRPADIVLLSEKPEVGRLAQPAPDAAPAGRFRRIQGQSVQTVAVLRAITTGQCQYRVSCHNFRSLM